MTLDDYAKKAGVRRAVLGELNEALEALAAAERRAAVAARTLETAERDAQTTLDGRLAELEREYQESVRVAKAVAADAAHSARCERGAADALRVKARATAQAARARLLRLVPSLDESDAVGEPGGGA